MARTEYEVTHENEIKRDPEKASYDIATIRSILEQAHFVNVAFIDEDSNPQCIPMVHAVTHTGSTLHIYLHGYHRARLVRLLPPETRVCITATLFDGISLALSAFSSSINHRSAVCHGEVADDMTPDEKWEASRQIVEHVCPGRWEDCRQPSSAEMNTTGFIKVNVLSASAKCRAGQPGEEMRDMRDQELVGGTWAGVIPVQTTYGKPEPSDFCKVPLPKYVDDYVSKPGTLSG